MSANKMADFKVHHVRFFEYQPKPVHCIAYQKDGERLAVSRSDGSLELWSINDNWYQEKVIIGSEDRSIEAIVWCGHRLFSAGLNGEVVEYDFNRLQPKTSTHSNAGPIWCLVKNSSNTKLAAGTEAGCVVLFDLTGGLLTYERAFDKQEGRILSLSWHVSEEVIVTGGVDNIRVWSTSSGHAMQRLTLRRVDNNKETIVWCVTITKDMTIISGDSRGKTCFWNGKQGTLIRSYQSHKADVLCLALNENEDAVVTSGADPIVAQFEFIPTKPSSDWKTWVRSSAKAQHSHDVRALAYAGQLVISGGVDTILICSRVERNRGMNITRRIRGVAQKNLFAVASEAELVVLNYTSYLEVWKLGSTASTSEKHGEILPLRESPVKLVQLKTKNSGSVVCFSISSNGKWLCYSDEESLRLYRLHLETDSVAPKVSLERVKLMCPLDSTAHKITFTPNSTKCVVAMCDGTVHVFGIESEYPNMQHSFPPPFSSENPAAVTLLEVGPNNQFIAVYYHNKAVSIFDMADNQHIGNLPNYPAQPTAMAFSPSSEQLVIAYTDQKVLEYSVNNLEYTPWCRANLTKFHKQWLKRQSKIGRISFNHCKPQQILLHDEQMLCVLDKTQPFPHPEIDLYSRMTWSQAPSSPVKHAFHICNKYKYLLHVEAMTEDWMLIVERPPKTMFDALPQTLKQKKFGT